MNEVGDPDGVRWLLNFGILIVGFVLSILTGLAWRRERDRKLMLVTVAYVLFALRGLTVVLEPVVEISFESQEVHPSLLVLLAELATHLSPLLVLTGLVLFFLAFTRS